MSLFCKILLKYKKFKKDTEAATAIEYALVAALISLGLVAGMGALKTKVATALETVGNRVITQTNG